MRKSGVVLTIRGRNNISIVTSIGAWVRVWLRGRVSGLSPKMTCLLLFRYDKIGYECALLEMMLSFWGWDVLEVSFSSLVVHCPFHLLYLSDLLGYWWGG